MNKFLQHVETVVFVIITICLLSATVIAQRLEVGSANTIASILLFLTVALGILYFYRRRQRLKREHAARYQYYSRNPQDFGSMFEADLFGGTYRGHSTRRGPDMFEQLFETHRRNASPPPPRPRAPTKDLYGALNIQRNATDDEIKKAFRKEAMKCHPDRFPGDAVKEARFKDINEAHQILSDAHKRAAYDRFGTID